MRAFDFLRKQRVRSTNINELLQRLSRRAERLDAKTQAATFVSLGGIENMLLNPDNRIIFGRRGTGKTHIMSYVADVARRRGEIAIQIDLRTMGSNSYLYSDSSIPLPERATRLLRDFLSALHDTILDEITTPKSSYNTSELSPVIDKLGDAVKEVIVCDRVERRQTDHDTSETQVGAEAAASIAGMWGSFRGNARSEHTRSGATARTHIDAGSIRLSVNVGEAHRALVDIGRQVDTRVWILVDEWSTIPEDLQPFLADFIKRIFFPIRTFSVHIAAIEQRSHFRASHGAISIGIELGSDAFADVDLDDYLVFENNPQQSLTFFKEVLFRHVTAVTEDGRPPTRDVDEFIQATFTQLPAFRELVRACEGVPRDAINILQLAATRAQDEKISIPHIRSSAKDWYERDKSAYVNSNPEGAALLHWIIDRVIGDRKARAFLVRNDVRSQILEDLFDERILHIAKKSYSTKHEPGIRYKVWKIDYGCYVGLINTAAAPTGFLIPGIEVEADWRQLVPEDDFRAIRRAILNLDEFVAQPPFPV